MLAVSLPQVGEGRAASALGLAATARAQLTLTEEQEFSLLPCVTLFRGIWGILILETEEPCPPAPVWRLLGALGASASHELFS